LNHDFDPYRELGLSAEAAAEPELVRAAFKALAKKYHPDGHSDPEAKRRAEEKMRRLNDAQSMILSGKYQPPPPTAVVVAPKVESSRPPVARNEVERATRVAPPQAAVVAAGLLILLAILVPALRGRGHLAEAHRLAALGQYQNALESANRAVTENPRNGEAYLLRAQLWVKLREPARARTDLANARGLVPAEQLERAAGELFPSPSPTPVVTPTPATWKG
jgi:tetratricopeptide (TPR) repeat protein